MSTSAAAPARRSEAAPGAAVCASSAATAGVRTQGSERKPAGYGLPCVKCKTYYPADLKVCPVCKATERVSPKVEPVRVVSGEVVPDLATLEAEREKFLQEFKAQLLASPMPDPSGSPARCRNEAQHHGAFEAAAICQSCFDHQLERIDQLEAALHIDLKEAAKIVYDAVWADPSDSDKTYENAAQAILLELRRRAGVTPTFGLMKPLTD